MTAATEQSVSIDTEEAPSIENAPRVTAKPVADALAAASQLSQMGWALLPLGKGKDGKSPSLKFGTVSRHPLHLIRERMQALNTAMFAVRLEGVVVVDADTDNAATRAYIEERFGVSPYRTKTARGFHSYWRRSEEGAVPQAVRRPGISIDFKSGPNQYVVAPGSTRADGQTYQSSMAALPSPERLPTFIDRDATSALPVPAVVQRLDGSVVTPRIRVGDRNRTLTKDAIRFARTSSSSESVLARLRLVTANECEQPESISNSELEAIANWAWGKRLGNKIYGGSKSMVKIPRSATEVLLPLPGGSEAFALFGFVSSIWEHQPGIPFGIVPSAIKKSGRLSMGRNQIYDAIKLLLTTGFLIMVHESRGARDPSRYLLGLGERVQREGERVCTYIDPFCGDEGATT